MNWRFIEVICFLFIWDHITVQSSRQDPLATEQHVTKQYEWLISDRGPFHHSRSYLSFVERFRQGFTTRYKIYREFARWKVRNTAIERRDLIRNPVPLMPEFQRSVRLLGRRPTTQQFIDTIIKKYGTHILISATLGGEEALTMYLAKNKLDRKLANSTQNVEALHQLASTYFIDRDGTMRKLHEIQISTNAIKVTETRTGPLGCSSYDNLDSVSSVLLQSPESKLHLQGKQSPPYQYFSYSCPVMF
uniref:BMP/retinoic acid-inducible neural-specific protein 1 n=1 Tax=Scophthalmus maximus TaxID=52904 RepID=A0A8D2ZUT5_SCOMX